jgi:hypothetical protein
MKGVATFLVITFINSVSWGQKINADFGFYSISAKGPSTSQSSGVNLSGPGSYSLSGQFSILPSFELGVGYTVFYSKFISGDMGLGPDLSAVWYPVNQGSGLAFNSQGLRYFEIQTWRPYAAISFHQRQFQSVESSYSGFGFSGGVEMQYSKETAFRATVRSMSLLGPAKSTFDYLDILIGLQLQFRN